LRRGNRVAAVAGTTGMVAAAIMAAAVNLLSADQPSAPRAEAAGPAPERCSARYIAEHRAGGAFTAEVVITNTGGAALDRWSLAFALPAGQRITDARGARLDQRGQAVTLVGEQPLAAGGTLRVAFAGTSGPAASAPTRFVLDGTPCTSSGSEVRGAQPGGSDQGTAQGGPAADRGVPAAAAVPAVSGQPGSSMSVTPSATSSHGTRRTRSALPRR
jgi:Cellulose binding domain